MKLHIKITASICFILLLIVFRTSAQTDRQLEPLDESIHYGRLSNGFSYYIKPTSDSSEKIHLHLLVKNDIEKEDTLQLDFPHAIEHLAFKKTEHFPKGLPNQMQMLENAGMENVGRDFNAFSSNRFTFYKFKIAKNNTKALNLGFLWFKDITHKKLKLTEKDINSVRGELKQEYLMRLGNEMQSIFAESKLNAQLFPCRKDITNYFDFVENFDANSLRDFYGTNYQPEQMAVSVVGNIDNIKAIENKIIKTFSELVSKDNNHKSDCSETYFNRAPQFVKVAEPLDSLNPVPKDKVKIKLIFRDPDTFSNLSNYKGLERLVYWNLIEKVLNRRFRLEENNYDNHYSIQGQYFYDFDRNPSAFIITINSQNNQEKEAFKKAVQLFTQFYQNGISKEEWNNIKKEYLISLKRDQTISDRINDIKEHFLYNKLLLAQRNEYLTDWLTSISTNEFNLAIQQMLSPQPQDIGILAPKGHQVLTIKERELRNSIDSTVTGTKSRYTYPSIPNRLISKSEKNKLKKVELTLLENQKEEETFLLKNGVKVVLKSFTPKGQVDRDKILIHGFQPKGAYCYEESNYFSAINAAPIIINSGVGEFNKYELKSFLSEANLSTWDVRPYINNMESGIKAKAKPKDIELILQLMYLYFTAPRIDLSAFENWKYNQQKAYLNPISNLDVADVKTIIGNYTLDASSQPEGTSLFEGINQTDVKKAFQIYKELFSSVNDYVFIFTGDFQIQKIKPLVQKYLGNIGEAQQSFHCNNDPSKYLEKGPIYKEIQGSQNYDLKNTNYRLQYIRKREPNEDWKELIKVRLLGAITSEMAWRIRFEKGIALYNLGVYSDLNPEMSRYEIKFRFECNPEDLEFIREECQRIIQSIKTGSMKSEFYKLGLKRIQREYSENELGKNQKVQEELYYHLRFKEELVDKSTIKNFINSIDEKDIIETANKYFKDRYKYEFEMKAN
tara:strand:+ start:4490 stop:7357 length:2868 start_codon:yes stop_codon:yes gene_type:complete